MKKQSSECKDNNAATVKGMMPSKVWIASCCEWQIANACL